ncbi:MAG: hypothetical protein U0531_08535 [Dehalococcoidia bacterium]
MRAVLAALLVVAAAVWSAPAVQAARTQQELASAALTATDLGPGFTAMDVSPQASSQSLGEIGHTGLFMRMPSLGNPSLEVVATVLIDVSSAGLISAQDVAADLDALRGAGISIDPAPAPAIGQDTVMLKLKGVMAGQPISGDIIGWQQGDVIAAVAVLGTGSPTALPYATRQQAKLAATFGIE